MSVHILCKNCPWPFCQKWPWTSFTQNFLFFGRKYPENVKIDLAGMAGQGPAGPYRREMVHMRGGADLTMDILFIGKRRFRSFSTISGPSRLQKWIRLEKIFILVVSGGLYDENKPI